MATAIKRRRGTTIQHSTFIGQNAELTVDTDKKVVVVHDGVTVGGKPLASQRVVDAIERSSLGDGATDDRTTLQAAVDATAVDGTLFIPATLSYFRVTDVITINKRMTVRIAGEVRSTVKEKVLFLVTSDDVTFEFVGRGALRGPGTFEQASEASSNYGALIEFRGASIAAPLKNCKVINPRLIDPPWAGLYFRYCDGWEVIGGSSVGGPTVQTGTNHFAILGFDSTNWRITGFENRGSAGGGYPCQVFNNTHSALTSSPGVMQGCLNLGSWDKLIYQTTSGAIVVGNRSFNVNAAGSKQSIRVGGTCRVAHNICQGGFLITGPNGADVSHNYIYEFDHVGIEFSYVGAIGATICTDIVCGFNTIKAATPGGVIAEVYEGIRIKSSAGVDIVNVRLDSNTIISADMCAVSAGGYSAKLGAISLTTGRAFAGVISIKNPIILSPGSHGIIITDGKFVTITGGEIRNPGSDTDPTVPVAVGVLLKTSGVGTVFEFSKVDGMKVIDDRGGASRLSASVAYNGAGNFNQDMTVVDTVALGVKAGELGLSLGSPYSATYKTQIGGNRIDYAPLIGQFSVLGGAAGPAAPVANANILSATLGYHGFIKITPLNAAAITLQAAAPLWVSSQIARTSFTPGTWNGTLNGGATALFQYEIVQ